MVRNTRLRLLLFSQNYRLMNVEDKTILFKKKNKIKNIFNLLDLFELKKHVQMPLRLVFQLVGLRLIPS